MLGCMKYHMQAMEKAMMMKVHQSMVLWKNVHRAFSAVSFARVMLICWKGVCCLLCDEVVVLEFCLTSIQSEVLSDDEQMGLCPTEGERERKTKREERRRERKTKREERRKGGEPYGRSTYFMISHNFAWGCRDWGWVGRSKHRIS